MQMRFDGTLGFPGGGVDKGPNEHPVDGLNRELQEEINLDLERFGLQHPEHHVISHVLHRRKIVLHFYAKEVTLKEFNEIERAQFEAEEWGVEVNRYMGTSEKRPALKVVLNGRWSFMRGK